MAKLERVLNKDFSALLLILPGQPFFQLHFSHLP